MPFAPEYVRYVLSENLEDAKALFLAPLMAIHYAHLIMLVRQKIIAPSEGHALREALDSVSETAVGSAKANEGIEDLFFCVEDLIAAACDAETAGRLHTARSRNDVDMTMYRMRQRQFVLELIGATAELRRSLLGIAERHRDVVFAAHTHAQPAQPTTLGHYMLAAVEQLERDTVRLQAAFETTNCSPLGACAITGTGFPIDRQLTTDLLGFAKPTINTYGSIASIDYLLESSSAAAVMLNGLGRIVHDLLLWCTPEFGYVRLSDGFVQCSSIMPQKRNPVALEHARAIASKAVGQASAILLVAHNTPFSDIVDLEDDLQPLVFTMFRDATRAVKLVAAALRCAEFNVALLEARAAEGWTTATELADALTRDHGLPFRASRQVVARLIAIIETDPAGSLADALALASQETIGRPIRYTEENLKRILSPHHFVTMRTTLGGPAPNETARALVQSQQALGRDESWERRAREHLDAAEARLRQESAAL